MIIQSLKSLAVPIDSLQALPGNPRRGDVDAVAASLSRFGQRKPIVVRKDDGTIIAGNHTWQAAKKLGWSEIAVAYVGDDDVTAQAYALADNRTAELGDYDDELLKQLIESVGSVDLDLLKDTGWSQDAVEELLTKIESENPKVIDEDEVPEVPVEPKTKLGDLYHLGRHRLLCGDSTDEETVARLMDGAKADMVFTDPPYGINYQARQNQDKIANDGDIETAKNVFIKSSKFYKEAKTIFICCDWRSISFVIESLEKNKMKPSATIVWDKGRPVSAFQKFGKSYELIVYCGSNKGPLVISDVWKVQRDFEPNHPTPKPIALIGNAIETSSFKNDIIFDSFGGSGSTLIAAEQTDRTCYMMELDPKYCDVIIQRWETLTGEKAVLVSNAESTKA
jgi:site-specific DNA-methyltransferase (adenine-specific)